jgi:hypothetical protein
MGLMAAGLTFGADAKYSIKTGAAPVPKEINESIAKLLSDQSIRLIDDKGAVLCELWLRKEVPLKSAGTAPTYRDLDETTILGAIRFPAQVTDYRKQKIKPGVYTLRLGFQPMDGDHMGTAPYPEFGLVVPADTDVKPDTMTAKELQEMSSKATGGSHPGVFLLYPNEKPEDAPKLVSKDSKTWVLNAKEATAGGQKAALGIGLTLIGHAD